MEAYFVQDFARSYNFNHGTIKKRLANRYTLKRQYRHNQQGIESEC